MSVLVIEDDQSLRMLLEAIFRRSGISARFVAGGDDAIDVIESEETNLHAILLDLILPGLNGFELLQRVRSTRPHLLSRMIVITGVSGTVLRTFQFDRFVWQVIRKPFDLDDLIGAVFDCMACHSGHRPSNADAFS